MSMAESFFFYHRKCNEKSGHYEKKNFFLKNQQNLWKQNIRNS